MPFPCNGLGYNDLAEQSLAMGLAIDHAMGSATTTTRAHVWIPHAFAHGHMCDALVGTNLYEFHAALFQTTGITSCNIMQASVHQASSHSK